MPLPDLDFLTPEGQAAILAALPSMTAAEKEALLGDLDELERIRGLDNYRGNFLAFCHHVYPEFKEGPHHRNMAKSLAEVIFGARNRLTVSMPPRFGKSITISYLFVAWYLGHNPGHHIMMVTHTADLSADFGRQVRNLLSSPIYREIFPNTVVSADKSAANNWATTAGGKYLAIGIGANVAGHGAHLLVADDLVSEQAVLSNPDTVFATAWNYMQVGPMQRLMPNGRIVMIGTRWGKKDPIGRALQWADQNTDSPPWHEIRFPAIMPSGKSLWPEQWPVDQLLAKKASMFPQFWAAQYMQEPTSEEGAIIKREWWRVWEKEKPPRCHTILQSWDTAHETKSKSDPSAVTTWGLFENEEENDQEQIILLDAWSGRKEFPDLKKFALEYYEEWDPDMVIIEKKAAGAPLIQELRNIGVPVQEYSPSRKGAGVANDKRARGNAIADIFASKMVWAPTHRWAREVIDQVAEFPNGDHDDLYDTCFVAGTRVRMSDGTLRNIEDVRVGDTVATPAGACAVVEAGCTGEKEIWELRAEGAVLCGTGNHPIAIGDDWIPLDKLVPLMQTVTLYQGEAAWVLRKKKAFGSRLLSFKAASTDVTRTVLKKCTAFISGGPGTYCTGMFGSTTTGLSQTDTTCTTSTKTRGITMSTTLNACPLLDIVQPMRTLLRSTCVQTGSNSTWPTYAPQPQSGTEATRGAHGTKTTRSRHLQQPGGPRRSTLLKWRLFAGGVAQKVLEATTRGFFADPAVKRPNRGTGLVSAVRCTHTMQPVYNLTVAGAECYYANDVLVHNCVQAMMRIRQGGFIRLDSDDKSDENADDYRRPVNYY